MAERSLFDSAGIFQTVIIKQESICFLVLICGGKLSFLIDNDPSAFAIEESDKAVAIVQPIGHAHQMPAAAKKRESTAAKLHAAVNR